MKTYLLPLVIGMALAAKIDAAVILDESFSYADGALTAVSAGAWATWSGTPLEVNVASGKVVVSQTEGEDVGRSLPGGPYTGPILYGSFMVNLSALPGAGSGTYFVTFNDGGQMNLKCRVFVTTSGAVAGTYRVGIANGSSTFVLIPQDLSLGTDYLLVVRYHTGTGASTLWINPDSEATTTNRAIAADPLAPISVTTFLLRQSNLNGGMGILTLDNLKIGTAFSDVVGGGSESYSLTITVSGADVKISWPVAATGFNLQFTDELPATWTDSADPVVVEGDQNVVRYPGSTGHKFFRLRKP